MMGALDRVFFRTSWTAKFQSLSVARLGVQSYHTNKFPLKMGWVLPWTANATSKLITRAVQSSHYMEGMRATGIGVIADVRVMWVVENASYPGEPRYVGQLRTTTGESYRFTADVSVTPQETGQTIVGRLIEAEEEYIHVTDTKR